MQIFCMNIYLIMQILVNKAQQETTWPGFASPPAWSDQHGKAGAA